MPSFLPHSVLTSRQRTSIENEEMSSDDELTLKTLSSLSLHGGNLTLFNTFGTKSQFWLPKEIEVIQLKTVRYSLHITCYLIFGGINHNGSYCGNFHRQVSRLNCRDLTVFLTEAIDAIAMVSWHKCHFAIIFIATHLNARLHAVCHSKPREFPRTQFVSQCNIGQNRTMRAF